MSRITFTRPDGTVVAVEDEATFMEALDTKFAEWKKQINLKYLSPLDGWSEDATMLLNRSYTTMNADIEEGGAYLFYNSPLLVSADLPNIRILSKYMFANCTALTTVNLPKAETFGEGIFDTCSVLTDIFAPNVVTLPQHCFRDCNSLRRLYFPNAKNTNGMNNFNFSPPDKCFVLLPAMKSVGNYFGQGSGVNVFLVFPQRTLVSLSGANISGSLKVYVPANMVEEYKNATNWSKTPGKIKSIEDDPDILAYMAEVGYEYIPTTAEVSE